jgi:heat shock protein HtpX
MFAALAMLLVAASYVVILLLAVACVYLPWLLFTNSSGFQSLAVLVAGVIMAASMLWSVLPRRDKFAVRGLRLERQMHPSLFDEIDNVAAALQEPIPKEIYLIPETNAWVANRGGFLGIGSRRILGVGLPLLGALNISQFRAILTHEFAHYCGGDTKLGPWLRRTQMSMIRTFQNMGAVGKAMRVAVMQILYAAVFGILKWYWLFFLRVINWVSRRQEFRADELACMVGGKQSFISGLQLVHGAALAWPAFCEQELAPMMNAGFLPSICDGFAQYLRAPNISKQVDLGIETEIKEGKGDPYDSHPPLRDRIAAAEAFAGQNHSESTLPASTLLQNTRITEAVFLHAVFPETPNDLKSLSWEEQATAVVIPSWKRFVTENGELITGAKVGGLFESLATVPQIAQMLRDPKGMLLSPEQRVQRARMLLGAALGLSLVRNGWRLHSHPGELYLANESERIDPFKLVLELSDGALSKENWVEKCRAFGIEGALLFNGQPAIADVV